METLNRCLCFLFASECLFYLSHSWFSFLRIYVSPDRPSWHQITSSKETGQNVWLPQDFKSIQPLRKPMSLRKAIRFPFETSASLKELQIKQISSGFHLIIVALNRWIGIKEIFVILRQKLRKKSWFPQFMTIFNNVEHFLLNLHAYYPRVLFIFHWVTAFQMTSVI